VTTLAPPDRQSAVFLGWSLHWRGKVFTESMLTGQHLSVLALLTGTDSFESLDINPGSGHQRLMQLLAAFVAVDTGATASGNDAVLALAIAEISTASAEEIIGALRYD